MMKAAAILTLLSCLLPSIHSQEHYLLLEIKFDNNPSQTAWKFTNARSADILDYKSFGYYEDGLAGSIVKQRLEILGGDDLSGDPLVDGVVREYTFSIYDEVSYILS